MSSYAAPSELSAVGMEMVFNPRYGLRALATPYFAVGWQLAAGHYLPANFAPQIIAPRSGLSITNRYYLAYTGLAYSVPVCVTGGAWPFKYQLSGAPSGMGIGQTYGSANYGVITWSNPVAGSYPLTVTVTDQQGATQTVSWTLTVQTANFIFVDSVNGHASIANGGSGTGTIANPFKTMNDWYAGTTGGSGSNTQGDTTYHGYFVYYRGNNSNSYSFNTCYAPGNGQIVMGPGKPTVHMAYPGDASPTFDVVTGNVCWYFNRLTEGLFVQGATFNGAPAATASSPFIFLCDSGVTDIGIFGNVFHEPATSPGSGVNAAFLISDDNLPYITKYITFVGNTIQGTNGFDGILAYSTEYCLMEGNTINGVNGATGGCFYAKDSGNSFWTVRNNTGLTGNTAAIGTQGLVTISDFSTIQNIEIVWNNYATTGSGLHLSLGDGGSVSDVYMGRNTWQVGAHSLTGTASLTGLFTVTNDVCDFTSGSANTNGWILNGNSMTDATFSGTECVGLNNAAVNAGGNLISPYLGYLYTRGVQVG